MLFRSESRPEEGTVSFTALDEAEAALAGDDELGDDDEPFGVDNDV